MKLAAQAVATIPRTIAGADRPFTNATHPAKKITLAHQYGISKKNGQKSPITIKNRQSNP
jgi:hypothetical protein